MVLLGDEAQVEARLVHLEIVLICTEDRSIQKIGAQFALNIP
jgi:hypothetical protein